MSVSACILHNLVRLYGLPVLLTEYVLPQSNGFTSDIARMVVQATSSFFEVQSSSKVLGKRARQHYRSYVGICLCSLKEVANLEEVLIADCVDWGTVEA